MWDRPDFLDLPARPGKPRVDGLTHVLDKGVPIPALDGVLAQAGELIDVLKIGWGIAYVDRTLKQRIALCDAAGILVSLGGLCWRWPPTADGWKSFAGGPSSRESARSRCPTGWVRSRSTARSTWSRSWRATSRCSRRQARRTAASRSSPCTGSTRCGATWMRGRAG